MKNPPGARIDCWPRNGGRAQLAFDDLGSPLEEVTFVVVDLETTGRAPGPNSITEIGAVKVRGGETIGEFSTLVDPGEPICPFVASLTGITTAMVAGAPKIGAVLPSFLEFLGANPDTVFVAHNARFDVGHLKAACAGMDAVWPKVRVLDTVKLAKRAFSREEAPNVKLSTLARICQARVTPTHRALDDARATVDVLHAMLARMGPLGVTHLEDLASAADPVPARRRAKARLADGLPRSPGVYHFVGPAGDVLYVGTSVNMYTRVRQYFTAAETRKRMAEMADLAVRVEAKPTATALEAGVLELRHIAELDPPYNRRSRRPDRLPWLMLTDEAHPRLAVTRKVPLDRLAEALGPFSSHSQARQAAQLIADHSRLRTCTKRLPPIPSDRAESCHLLELGRCAAPCVHKDADVEARRVAASILAGACEGLWERQMERLSLLAEQERFEQAGTERDRLRAVLVAQRRRERLSPLLLSSEIVAARRGESGWDVVVVRYGRLAGTARAQDDPLGVAEALTRTCEAVERPVLAGGAAHPEETELLASWLWNERTRLISLSAGAALALPRRSAARFRLPESDRQKATGPDADRR